MTTTRESSAPNKFPASANRDPEGPRLIPLKEDPEPNGGLTGVNYVSLANSALKVWESADKKANKHKPVKKKSAANAAK